MLKLRNLRKKEIERLEKELEEKKSIIKSLIDKLNKIGTVLVKQQLVFVILMEQ
jgi:predicted RNase H-like nuclease (RuvC/YqgF family)